MLRLLKTADLTNPNGSSVSILQRSLSLIHLWFLRHPTVSRIILAYPVISAGEDRLVRQQKIEIFVWRRLLVVSLLALLVEAVLSFLQETFQILILAPIGLYILILQLTLLLSLLRPLFGVAVVPNELRIDNTELHKRTPQIPAPRRSLLLALVNFFEILLGWAIIYRCVMPSVVKTMDQANYFSVVTLTTLGYGEINAGPSLIAQLAITANMIVFLVFSICHFTTIMGAMSSGGDFRNGQNRDENINE